MRISLKQITSRHMLDVGTGAEAGARRAKRAFAHPTIQFERDAP